MASPPPAALESTLIFLVIIVLILVRRTYGQLSGALYGPIRLFGFATFALLLYALFASTTLYAAIGTWGSVAGALVAPYALVPALSAYIVAPHVRRVVRFERRGDDRVYYRLPWLIPLLYLVLFIARLSIEFVVLGPSAFGSFVLPAALPRETLAILTGFDLLYGASLGLLFGRAWGVRTAYHAFSKGASPASGNLGSPPESTGSEPRSVL
jgi:hypothetical protein